MPTNEVKLGTGLATGMFFHAPAGTALPAYPSAELAEAWEEVGFVAQDGITWHHGRSGEALKDWSNTIRRVLESSDDKTIAVPIISTTAEVLKTIFGAANVEETAANTTHGNLLKVASADGIMSGEEAFLFLMKDGDDMIAIGTTSGFISALDDITFAPGSPITWNATVNMSNWTMILDDGQVTASTGGGGDGNANQGATQGQSGQTGSP